MDDDINDAKTLAAWCSRSSAAYNLGAWQTALLLRPKSFRRLVASLLMEMELPLDNPAIVQWRTELGEIEVSA